MRPLLSKTDFKAASTCPAKLYYRKLGYPDARGQNAYLQLLARGGYMVEKMAKLLHPDGIDIDTSAGHGAAAEQTRALLQANASITLFEATFIHDGMLARADILRKVDGRIELMEVKSSLFDPEAAGKRFEKTGSYFRSMRSPHPIAAEWVDYLEDVAFQYCIVKDSYPHLDVIPYLVLIDKAYTCVVEGLPQRFIIRRSETGRMIDVEFLGDPNDVRLHPMTVALEIAAEVQEIEPQVRARATELRESLAPTLRRIGVQPGRQCLDCEYDVPNNVERSGFRECWGARAEDRPLTIELYRGGKLIDELLAEGVSGIAAIAENRIAGAGKVAERQRIQVLHTRSRTEWLDPRLAVALGAVSYPLFFIDFEAAALAVPQHVGMRAYGVRAFQWSCHVLREGDGSLVHHEWLNNEDPWPNQAFAESLRAVVGDSGSILVWSPYESTILKDIARELSDRSGECAELAAWLMRTSTAERIVDLHALCRSFYFHPIMGRRTSIKNVLEAIWLSYAEVRRRFEEIEGYAGHPELGPYAALPPLEIGGVEEVVSDGGNAVRAYEAMMYGLESSDPAIRAAWRGLLLRYCRLDTLAMVLIWEHWSRQLGRRSDDAVSHRENILGKPTAAVEPVPDGGA